MPGFELFGEAERNEVNDVLQSGVLMRYGFDGMRNGHWKAKDLERELQKQLKGKSCFHLKKCSKETLNEISRLIDKGISLYKKDQLI